MSTLARGKHLHLDCPSGVAGDMLLGALFDLGVPVDAVKAVLATLPIHAGWHLHVDRCVRGGLAGTDVKVHVEAHEHHHHEPGHGHDHAHGDVRHEGWHAHGHAHRHYREIRAMLDVLPDDVRRIARAVFERVAVAEAKLHATTVDEVAFHEVGAVDSIIDIVGTAAAVAHLGPASISSTPLPLGHGTIRVAHGILPVPAPATLEILAAASVPTTDGGAPFELTTPTGAALVAELVQRFAPMPSGRVLATGWGAGDRELPDRPNLVRAVLLDATAAAGADADEIVELVANIDDMNPELCDHVLERLFAAGAVDAWWSPITMKKGRPALQLGVLAPPAAAEAVARVVLTETTSIGLRQRTLARRVLERRHAIVDTPYGPLRVKLALLDGRIVNAAPEHDDCRRLAAEGAVPLKDVYAAATAASQALRK
jgi:hypothetical protein